MKCIGKWMELEKNYTELCNPAEERQMLQAIYMDTYGSQASRKGWADQEIL